ncbi:MULTISPECIES: hypothetical protein [Candidatus Nitrosocaldus]|jgi:hypothetical protein|uniref:Uncharacterized protein n=1 Tax=Candidatus Nitrosocaldus cavascurensis TaxID=2058097 RepID=A0A2K5ARC0_9ARCH|nr:MULTISPECIES: hypothetical protein [Candidatus Nitrosocaldus]SPC34202.1 protein of unknown function [Candidatus Nitrosocaldus cavascurensis]
MTVTEGERGDRTRSIRKFLYYTLLTIVYLLKGIVLILTLLIMLGEKGLKRLKV